MIAAGKPQVIRILVVEGGHMVDEADPLAEWARALVYARQDRYEQAVRSLRTTVEWPDFDFGTEGAQMMGYGQSHVRELRRRRLVWLAGFTYRAGDPPAAAELAREAAASYRLSGAFNEAAAIDDFREKMLWLGSRAFAQGAFFERVSQYELLER
jgi:hypothetical protein